jgi:hypothetical protein
METKKLLAIGIIIILGISVGAVILLNQFATNFQYVQYYTQNYDYYLEFWHLEDCNVTVKFVNVTTLVYKLDIEQYESGEAFEYETTITEDNRFFMFFRGLQRFKSLTVTLGTATGCNLLFHKGVNLNATVTYDNGAVLGGREFIFLSSGNLNFILTKNVNYESGFKVFIGGASVDKHRADYVNLDITLTDGLNGKLAFLDGNFTPPCNYSVLEMDGWDYRGTIPIPNTTKNRVNVTYSTDLTDEPLLDMWISALNAVAYLK